MTPEIITSCIAWLSLKKIRREPRDRANIDKLMASLTYLWKQTRSDHDTTEEATEVAFADFEHHPLYRMLEMIQSAR
jgi:hypothetical protein